MRIVVFSTLFPPNVVGGAEKTVEILALGLAGQGAEVHVVTTDPEEDRSQREGSLHVHRVRLRNLYWPHPRTIRRPAWQRALWHVRDIHNAPMGRVADQLLDEIRPDVVLTFNIQGFSTAVWGAAFRHRQPLVHVIQDYWLLCPRTTMFKDGRNCGPSCASCRLLTLPRRRLTDRIDAVVGISRAVLEQHKAEGLFARVPVQRVIHNARGMATRRKDGEEARRGGPLRIGFFGRVSREKGFEFLLDELAAMDQEDWILLVGGRCPPGYVADLRRRRSLDRVSFLGFVDPESFFDRIDLLVVPSLWREPFGSVAIEAMGSGTPVIVSARGGLPEVVGDIGGGLVFDPGDPGSLRQRLSPFVRAPGLTSSLRLEMLGRTRHFTVQRQVASYVRLLDEVLATRAPPPAAGEGV